MMSESLTELEQQARALPPHDRARLAEVLLESLQGPPLSDVEAAWSRAIEERSRADSGNPSACARTDWRGHRASCRIPSVG